MDEEKPINDTDTQQASKNSSPVKIRQWRLINEARLKLLLKQLPMGIFLSIIVTFFVFIVLKNNADQTILLSWLGVMIGLSLILIALPIYFLRKKLYRKFNWSLTIISTLMFFLGIFWGMIGYVFINDGDLFHKAFIIMIVFGLGAGAMPILSVFIQVYLLFYLPVLVPFIIWLAINPTLNIYWVLSVSIYLIIVIGSSYYMHKYILRFLNP